MNKLILLESKRENILFTSSYSGCYIFTNKIKNTYNSKKYLSSELG